MVPLTHANICQSAYNVGAVVALQPQDRLLSVLPLFHGHGLISGVLSALAAGSSVVCTSGFEATDFFRWLAQFRPTWYTAVPTIHRAILSEARHQKGSLEHCSVRIIRSASSPLPVDVLEGLEAAFRVPVIETYGMTEASTQIAANPPGRRKLGSVGKQAGPEITILDDNDQILPAGIRGEIALRGPTIARGYDNDPIATAAAFRDGWFRTGDVGYLDQDGYLFILGRTRPADVINRGGQKVAPRQVEETLLSHPEVVEALVFPVPHNRLGEDVAAVVVLQRGAKLTSQDLRQFASKRLARFKVPSVIQSIAQIPRDASGKINREKLLEGLHTSARRQITETTVAPARSELQRKLAELWADLLEVDRVGLDQDVFELGADSLTVTQMLTRIRSTYGVGLSFKDILDAPTTAALALRLSGTNLLPSIPRSEKTSAHPRRRHLSFQQQRIYFLCKLDTTSHSYNIMDVLRLRGRCDLHAMEEALVAVAKRHEVLRSTFWEEAGEPAQVVGRVGPLLEQVNLEQCSKRGRTAVLRRKALELFREPIDLRKGPIFRAQLMRFADDDHALAIKLHHLVTDGLSQRLFWNDLSTFYNCRLNRAHAQLPDLPVQYQNFVDWQAAWLQTADAEKQRSYWRAQLRDLSRLPFRTDKPQPREPNMRGARQLVVLSPNLTRRVKLLSRSHRVTPFMVLLAAFQCLLFRYTHHDDIAIGSLIANRNQMHSENLMGMFSNTVVLRTDLSGDPTFLEILDRVRQVTLDAFENQDLPIEEALKALRISRNANHHALLGVIFKFQNAPLRAPFLPQAKTRFVDVSLGVAHHDLALELIDSGQRIHGWLEYNTDLFEAATMKRIAMHFATLLEAAIAHPEKRISHPPLLSTAERRRILFDLNDTHTSERRGGGFWQRFSKQADDTPDAVAVSIGVQRETYRELARRSSAIARVLVESGIDRNAIVVLCATRGVNFLAALTAVQRARGAFLPLDPSLPAARLAQIIEHSGTSLVLTDGHLLRALQEVLSQIPSVSRPQLYSLENLPPATAARRQRLSPPAPSSLAYVLYTSGSTGVPKGAMVEQRGLFNHLCSQISDLGLSASDVVAQTAPQSFVLSVWQFLAPLMVGARVHIVPDDAIYDLENLTSEIEREGVTVLQVVPSVLRAIVTQAPHDPAFGALRRLRWLMCCGEILPPDLLAAWFQHFPQVRVLHAYGQTECADDVTTCQFSGPPTGSAVSIGKPIANMRVYVLDATLQPVPIGVAGELHVGGVGVGRGYLNDPEQTGRSFILDPFSTNRRARLYRTGDLGRWRTDGTLEFLGRLDHQVKIRGCRVEPGEIENALLRHPAVQAAIVLIRNDMGIEASLVAHVEVVASAHLDATELRDYLKTKLPGYMIPSGFLFLAHLPQTLGGKIDRQALLANTDQIRATATDFVAPRNPTEEALTDIWKDLLGLDRVGVLDNFFDLGGHSLLAGQVVARIASTLGRSLPIKELFAAPTVEALARLLSRTHRSDDAVIETIQKNRSASPTLSLFQEHILSIERELPGLPQFTLPFAFRLQGHVDVTKVETSIAEVVERHEALRTHFAWQKKRLVALIEPPTQPRSLVVVEDLFSDIPDDRHSRALLLQKAELLAEQEAWTPFDLTRGPLLRARLLKIGADEHVLLLTLHHAIIDGWSIGILFREISQIYHGYATGIQTMLAKPELQFSDFARWQRRWCTTEAANRQVTYWKEHLNDAVPLFSAGDRADARLSSPVADVPFNIESGLLARLSVFSRARGATLFMTLLTAFKVLLLARCGRNDICVATPMANRSQIWTEPIIGPMANTTVIRSKLDSDPSFDEALDRVRSVVLEAHARQQLPFDILAARLVYEEDRDPLPLLQVFFELQSSSRQSLTLLDVATHPFGNIHREGFPRLPIDRTWLTATLRQGPMGIAGSFVYKSDLIDSASARHWPVHYTSILRKLSTDPRIRLSELARL